MKIMMTAGEASGDLHGSHLARKIIELHPEARLFGMGGPLMKEAGVDIIFDPTQRSAVGFTESLKNARYFRRMMKQLALFMVEEAPDVFVPLDFPSFNLPLAKQAYAVNVPTVYYLSPSAWIWGAQRAELIANLGITVCAIFPFEYEFYRERGTHVIYVGHPLLDIIPTEDTSDMLQYVRTVKEDPLIALVPGSRVHEIERLIPPMLETLRFVRAQLPDVQAVIPVAPTIDLSFVQRLIGDEQVQLVREKTAHVLQRADAAVITSGTATLEAALVGTPQVIVYKMSPLSYFIGKLMVKLPYVGLPNIVANDRIVPEILQRDVCGSKVAAELIPLLTDTATRQTMLTRYNQVAQTLGSAGAIERTANIVLATGRGNKVCPDTHGIQGVK